MIKINSIDIALINIIILVIGPKLLLPIVYNVYVILHLVLFTIIHTLRNLGIRGFYL